MPAEWEPHKEIWMIWPEYPDQWRNGAKPAQLEFVRLATEISKFTPVTMCASKEQYCNCRARCPESVRVVELSVNGGWARDTGPTFVTNDKGAVRGIHWDFNAYGGLYDGIFFPWQYDRMIARKMCEIERIDEYHTPGFVLEGGSIHVDGEGTVLTTESVLLSPGRNPHLTKAEIEQKLKDYLDVTKVIWVKEGVDPDETNGHIDDVACFVAPSVVACIWTDDENHPFYEASHSAYETLCNETDAKGRKLQVHKICVPDPICLPPHFEDSFDIIEGVKPRYGGDLCPGSYLNFLITNGGALVPQFGDKNDKLALEQIQAIMPNHKVVGVFTKEILYDGGNIHCVTQQQPSN